MKIAISVPDPVYRAGELLAHRLKVSRSELYSKALGELLAQQGGRGEVSPITEALNRVYAQQSNMEPDIEAAAMEILAGTEWKRPARRASRSRKRK